MGYSALSPRRIAGMPLRGRREYPEASDRPVGLASGYESHPWDSP